MSPPSRLDEVIRHYLTEVLAHAGGRIGGPGGAAALLGVNQHTLRSRMDRLGITYRKDR